MHSQVDGLLALSRLGSSPPSLPVQPASIVAGILETLREIPEAARSQISVGALPDVLSSAGNLRLLFHNLIENALRYRAPGRDPVVRLEGSRRDAVALFSVTDNGIGIPEDQRERVFAVFKRLHAQHEIPGAGIGLALCRKIAERDGGRIWTTGRPDGAEGSVFWIELPAAPGGES
jgi:two-component system, chemotaxis family, sensor kinase Cph1